MENLSYLFAAYTIIWAFIFGFVFFLYYRQRKLRQQIDSLKESIGKQQDRSASKVDTDNGPG